MVVAREGCHGGDMGVIELIDKGVGSSHGNQAKKLKFLGFTICGWLVGTSPEHIS
jgi:hypothetical protein